MQVEFIEIDGLRIRYGTVGSGRPVFMLHGWGGDMNSFALLMECLDLKKYRIFLPDMPGFGKSSNPRKAWNLADYEKFFGKFVQKMYTKHKLRGEYDLIVHSFGGRVAIKLFAMQTDCKPRKLIMIAPAGIKHSLTFCKRICRNLAKLGVAVFSLPGLSVFKNGARKLLYKILRTHDYERTSGVMRKTFLNVISEDLAANLEQINCPTLIIWGTDDTYVPVSDAYFMNRQIKNSQLKIVKGGRHGIHKTHAKQLAKWICEFLKQ